MSLAKYIIAHASSDLTPDRQEKRRESYARNKGHIPGDRYREKHEIRLQREAKR